MEDNDLAMRDTEYLLWLLTWDCMMEEGKGLSAEQVELICCIITARKKALSDTGHDGGKLKGQKKSGKHTSR